MIVSWPNGIKAKGEVRDQFCHATDVAPTIYDCLGVELPDEVKGLRPDPDRGHELPLLVRGGGTDRQGHRLLRDARVAGHLAQGLEGGLGPSHHRRVEQLRARSVGALQHHEKTAPRCTTSPPSTPGSSRSSSTSGSTRPAATTACRSRTGPRSKSSPRSAPQIGRRATATCTTRTAPRCPSRPRSTSGTAPTRSPPRSTSRLPDAVGVLFSHGCKFGGHSLYVADRKLKYVYNFCGIVEQMVSLDRGRPRRPDDPLRGIRA